MTLIIDMASGDTLESTVVPYNMQPPHDEPRHSLEAPSGELSLRLEMVAPATQATEQTIPQTLVGTDITQFLNDID